MRDKVPSSNHGVRAAQLNRLTAVYSALEHICQIAFVAGVPALLVAKFIWRQRIPWWSVILLAMLLSTALGILLDYLGPLAHFERFDTCIRASASGPSEIDCGYGTYDVSYTPIFLK